MAAHVLVVEDDPGIRELLRVNLARAGHQVLCVDDAESAKAALRSDLPDLMLIDWMLPGMSGIDLARHLKREARSARIAIIMLTARDADRDKVMALDVGADDYVTKPFSVRELLSRIAAVLRRGVPLAADNVVELGTVRLDPATRRVTMAGVPLSVGAVEFKLLHFLMAHPDQVHTRARLLECVWGNEDALDYRAVDVQVRRLRTILGRSGGPLGIQTIRGTGYLLANQLADRES